MLDPYLYHDERLFRRGFFEACFGLRLGGHRSDPRIRGYGGPAEDGSIQGDFASQCLLPSEMMGFDNELRESLQA